VPSAYLIIAHGSREAGSNQAFLSLVRKVKKAAGKSAVVGAFLELASPGVLEGVERCVSAGADEVFVVPLMLFPGRHVKRDIPRLIQEAKRRHRNVTFHYSGPLSDHPMLAALLARKMMPLKRRKP